MAKSKYLNDDLFSRAELIRLRHPDNRRDARREAEAAAGESLLQALVAAAAIIAHADGQMDIAERHRIIETFTTSAPLNGFSVADLANELAQHLRAYAHDPISAERDALLALGLLDLAEKEKELIAGMCSRVIAADGMVHPAELGALHRIERVLGLNEATR
jgi:tellurite resistance protein